LRSGLLLPTSGVAVAEGGVEAAISGLVGATNGVASADGRLAGAADGEDGRGAGIDEARGGTGVDEARGGAGVDEARDGAGVDEARDGAGDEGRDGAGDEACAAGAAEGCGAGVDGLCAVAATCGSLAGAGISSPPHSESISSVGGAIEGIGGLPLTRSLSDRLSVIALTLAFSRLAAQIKRARTPWPQTAVNGRSRDGPLH